MRLNRFMRDATATILVTATSGWLAGFIATNGRSNEELLKPVLLAILCVLGVFLPGIVLRLWVFRGPNRFLAALAWRFSAGLGALLMVFAWQMPERKTFAVALLTCYFAALLLESWLEVKQAQLGAEP